VGKAVMDLLIVLILSESAGHAHVKASFGPIAKKKEQNYNIWIILKILKLNSMGCQRIMNERAHTMGEIP
jgi:hypothetical protein